MTSYKTCAVPMCRSTTIKFPDKLFIHVPKCPKRRKQWLKLARRDPELTSDKATIFFCEDHFDLPNDMENYIEYSVMGFVGKIKMKPDCLPSKFQCQPDRIKRTAPLQPRSAVSKRQRMDIMQEMFFEGTEIPATSGMLSYNDFLSTSEKDDCSKLQDQATQVYTERINKSIQVCLSAKIRSRSVQASSQVKDKNTSPMKTYVTTTATSPFKIKSGRKSARNTEIRKQLLFGDKLEVSSSNSSSPSKVNIHS